MKKNKTLPIVLIAVLLMGCIGILAALRITTNNTSPVRIYLADDCSYRELCDTLVANGVINHTGLFRLASQVRGLKKNVIPGSYRVQPRTRQIALVQKLYRGQQDPIRLTIGKFRTPEQLENYLNSKLMHNNFEIALDSFLLVRPDTYEVYWTITPQQFMQRMAIEYDKFWKKTAKGSSLSRIEALKKNPVVCDGQLAAIIIASIVEEETQYGPEKPLVASVYWNRLKRGIPLQADPTVKYAVGDFSLRRILNVHLATESPFNTYIHPGLPPAPICLPSSSTLDAVISAPQTEYLYFCASDKMDGTHRFAATLAEHNRNAALFHTALNQRGIK